MLVPKRTARAEAHEFTNPVTAHIVSFLRRIGIAVHAAELHGAGFLPGLHIRGGTLLVDEGALQWPGDLLHEAGHIAVTPSALRPGLCGSVTSDAGDEIAAIAWSYAALLHLGLDAEVVFHRGGYGADSRTLSDNFTRGYYIGVPMLQLRGIALDEKTAAECGRAAYPHVIRWLAE